MKLVQLLFKKFIPVLVVSMLFFVLLLSLADIFVNIWSYMSHAVPVATVLRITAYFIPKAVWYAVPIAMLFATAYVLSDFYAKNELLAVFASGVSLFRFTLPLLILSLVMSVGLFVFDEYVVVPAYAKKTSLQAQVLNRDFTSSNDHIVIMADEGSIVYNAEYFDNELTRLYVLTVVFRTEDRSLDRILTADSALWQDDHWVLSNGYEYVYEDGNVNRKTPSSVYVERLTEPPETFRNNTIDVEEVSAREAKAYILRQQRNGLPVASAKANYYKKFSFPFVVLVVVFVAIGLSGRTRKNVLLVSLALSLAAVVLFYVVQMVTMLMAEFETIPAVMGAWFPVLLFVVLSAVLVRYSKT
ncbi:MAG: LptF/LptG family permease [Treponema sp.]|nr:LptF/LptG family permease [Treponema sp.]